MKIPKFLKIAGLKYSVRFHKEEKTGNGNWGTHWSRYLIIMLLDNINKQQVESTFLHEIIEAVNQRYQIKLKHDQICILETGLYQVLKENKLYFGD